MSKHSVNTSLHSTSAGTSQERDDGAGQQAEPIFVNENIPAEVRMRAHSHEGPDAQSDAATPACCLAEGREGTNNHDSIPFYQWPSDRASWAGIREDQGTSASYYERNSDQQHRQGNWQQEMEGINVELVTATSLPHFAHHQDSIQSTLPLEGEALEAKEIDQVLAQPPLPYQSTSVFSPTEVIPPQTSSIPGERVESPSTPAYAPKQGVEEQRFGRSSLPLSPTARSSKSHKAHLCDTAATCSVDSVSTLITRDSFGYAAYHPIFRYTTTLRDSNVFDSTATRVKTVGPRYQRAIAAWAGSSGDSGPPEKALHAPMMSDVPWDLRNFSDQNAKTFAFLSTRYFWFLIEYALRVTIIAMLVPAALINTSLPHKPFVSPTFALTSVVLAAGTNSGQVSLFLVHCIRASVIWLPISTLCVALKLNRHLVVWFFVYVVVLFLMAAFTEKMTRRLCLLLFNICMVNLLTGDESLVFPARALADWALGATFALVAMLIPYPLLATRTSAKITKIMFSNTATCFTGILSCFWALSNTERSMSMVRIRSLVRTMDSLVEKFDSYDVHTFYEVLIYETRECREVRREKVQLLLKLKMDLRAMERVVNMLQEKPQMINQSQRCSLLRDYLSAPMDDISRSMEALLWNISAAKRYDELKTLSGYFDAAGRAVKRLQNEFSVGRRVLLYENGKSLLNAENRMEEFLPLITFFVFSIVNFWNTLEEFGLFIHRRDATKTWKSTIVFIRSVLREPFVENAVLIRLLCVRRAEPELRIVLEAAKVSVAMLISVIFFYYIDKGNLLFSGPTIIAFVSGMNPVEAVQAGAARMSGTLIGSVLGFFAASLCNTAADRVAALCVITFVMTFLRPGPKFGVVCMYCNFVSVSALAPSKQTAAVTISRIQQNTFAIFIYCLISVAVFPVSPNEVLLKKRMAVMRGLNNAIQKLTALFNDAAQSYSKINTDENKGDKAVNSMATIVTTSTPARHNNDEELSNGNQKLAGSVGNILAFDLASYGLPGRRFSQGDPSGLFAAMPGTFITAPEDTKVKELFVDVFEMLDIMKETTSLMPLATDEFQLTPQNYPLRASGDIHAALYRLCALVYTMTCSWKMMREKNYFTSEMLHIFHNLAPIVNDIGSCLDRFVHVMDFYLRTPSSGLSSELTKSVTQLRFMCLELNIRKERDLFAVARQTIRKHRIRQKKNRNHRSEADSGSEGSASHGASVSHRYPRRWRSEQSKGKNHSQTRWMAKERGGGTAPRPRGKKNWPGGTKRQDGNKSSNASYTSRYTTHYSDAAPRRDWGARRGSSGRYSRAARRNSTETPLSNPMHTVHGARAGATHVFGVGESPSPVLDRGQVDVMRRDNAHGSRAPAASSPFSTSCDRGNDFYSNTLVSSSPALTSLPMPIDLLRSTRHHSKGHPSSPPVRRKEAVALDPATRRAEKLRENIRIFQRQSSNSTHTKRRRSAWMRPFGASYGVNYTDLTELRTYLNSQDDASLGESSHRQGGRTHHRVPRSHLKGQRGHDYVEEERWRTATRLDGVRHLNDGDRGNSTNGGGTVYGTGAEGFSAHSGCETNAVVQEAVTRTTEGGTTCFTDFDLSQKEYLNLGTNAADPASRAVSPLTQRTGTQRPIIHGDCIGRGVSADSVGGHIDLRKAKDDHTGAASPSLRHSSSLPPDSEDDDFGSHSDSSTPSDPSEESLVLFNESFNTPVTVQDAEGLHSFTLSLEMFSKELRKALYGFEEMMQSL